MKTGIIGGAGYTAGELLRILIHHPEAKIVFVHSASNAGNKISSVHTDLEGDTDLVFSSEAPLADIDVLFMCSGHGQSSSFWAGHERPAGLRVVDLAQDYRDEHDGYVYGLTELNAARTAGAMSVANPGCFATAIQLGLLPLAANGLLNGDVNITAITGSTGAGVKPSATTHFSWRDNNLSVYKAFTHQHLAEIGRTLTSLQPDFNADNLFFVPMRGDFPRGIFATITTDCAADLDTLYALYRSYYAGATFTIVSDAPIHLKQVVNTNKALVHLDKHGRKLLATVAIDNLLKGASGQAVQNMNLMFGLDPATGLRLKTSAF